MGDFAYLTIGKYSFRSIKYEIPYSWTIIFDTLSACGRCTTDVSSALKILQSKGLSLDDLENHISDYTGWSAEHWKRYRSFILTEDSDRLNKILQEDGFDADSDEEYPDVLQLLEDLELGEGLWELVGLYKMVLALNNCGASEKVILDTTQFKQYYDDDHFIQIYTDVKQNFMDKVRMYDYLFSRTVDTTDIVSVVNEKVTQFSEDDLINRVILPLFSKMKFQGAERTPHHGPKEHGLDIRPFYDTDKFGRRIYYGAQVKAIDIHTNANKEGNAASINYQIELALSYYFLDKEDNEKKRIDKIFLITSGKINDDARDFLRQKNSNRTLSLIDGNELSVLIVKYGLVDYILHTKKSRKRKAYYYKIR